MSKVPVGRGGLKLEAAIRRFGLQASIRRARVVDVGASTGGFTEVLLDHGAARVTAVDVGHGQLHARLAADPRVESLEGADWKTLSLAVAPGPFDLFTVDVSFVAARSMLRSLAFRLRPGAEGVVLIKPQFEVPGHRVRGGDVSDPALRARAVESFRAKAEALGFILVDSFDSPVAGGEGTVEILAHLRFGGRTAKLPPAPGEEARARPDAARPARGAPSPARPAPGPRGQRRAASGEGPRRWFVVVAPGLEEVAAAEVERLPGAIDVARVAGGVELTGPPEVGMAANLRLRIATRVVVRLGAVRAREFSKLRRLLGKLGWESFVPGEVPLKLNVSARGCRLYHTGAVAETAALAIADRLGRAPPEAPRDRDAGPGEDEPEASDAPVTRVLLRGDRDEWTASVDSSGALLHRRGWRTEAGRAPLRETLAAGLLALAGYDPALPFVDPMCGSGTLALEAAALALDRAPGLGRGFAFERWPSFDPAAWQRVRAAAEAQARATAPAPLLAFDRDPEAVARARRNAERAGVGGQVTITEGRLADARPPAPAGLVLLNPPYGRRLPTGGAGALRALGRELRARFPGWRAGVLVPAGGADRALGLPVQASHALSNGGLRVRLLLADLPPARG